MGLYDKYYPKLSILKTNFENILERLQTEKDFDKKLSLAICGAKYFVYNNSGYFTSSVLEQFFIDFAKKIKVDIKNINYTKNSFLHVMTQGYQTGGHTRVIERWIENAQNDQIHSVVLTNKNDSVLNTLQNNIKNKNGKYIELKNSLSLEEKAIELRKLAMEYEYVILHTHMEDPLPIIAFGVEEFTRPVLLYNHASHMPWLGKSIADLVLDIEKDDEVTKIKRGIIDTYFLGVPAKKINLTTTNKTESRKKLNLPLDKKIIITSGAESRFRVISGNSFTDYLKNITDENTFCYAIGIKRKNKEWGRVKKETNNRIIPLGFIPFDKGYLDYIRSADLYLDSYPLCGGTATIDAISQGIPVLSLKSVYPQFDYITRTNAYCQTKEEFIEKSKRILNDKQYANEILEETRDSLLKYQSIDAWNKNIEKLLEIAPKKHKVRDLSNVKDYSENNDLSVLCNVIIDNKFLNKKLNLYSNKDIDNIIQYGLLYRTQGIPYIFQIFSYLKYNKKTKIFKLFNIKVFTKCLKS